MPYVGEIRMFAGNFAPAGWAFCDGRLLPISENETLYQLIGTTYGGDGQETFALPDLRGRAPVHQGQGPGLSSYRIPGEHYGVEQVTLTLPQVPRHDHPLLAGGEPTSPSPVGAAPARPAGGAAYVDGPATPGQTLHPQTLRPEGGDQPHENMMPTLTVSFIISLFGIFPSQT
ncbi:phage tail protein [Nocardioides sp. SYSU DS0663]|uniref:phage tail protein n=1 Tax=Nocardioides sp. SYSU DS0663 TaxID=3416445 RepID=UPI003F4C938A